MTASAPSARPGRDPSVRDWRSLAVPSLAVVGVGIALAALGAGRTWFTFGTESDYLFFFKSDAIRAAAGQPLLAQYHPPLYSLTVAVAQAMLGDWFRTGLVLSWLGVVGGLVAGGWMIRSLEVGRMATWGAVIAGATSPALLYFGALASSDAFFFGLYTLAFALMVAAGRRRSGALWVLGGIAVGATILTRTNGITALLGLLLPWATEGTRRERFGAVARAAAGCAATIGAWLVAARLTGSNAWPSGTYLNLALTYFAPSDDRIGVESLTAVRRQFHGLADVLLHDPRRMAAIYVRDGLYALKQTFANDWLVAFPLNLLALPGLVLLPTRGRRVAVTMVLLAAAAQFLLVNLKAYEIRYTLYLIPLLGAAAGAGLEATLGALAHPLARRAVTAVLGLALLASTTQGMHRARAKLHVQDAEVGEVVPQARQVVPPGSILVARHPVVGHHLDAPFVLIPEVATADELGAALRPMADTARVYLYFGSAEQRRRKSLAALAHPDSAPPWLVPMLRSRTPGAWALYEVRPAEAGAGALAGRESGS